MEEKETKEKLVYITTPDLREKPTIAMLYIHEFFMIGALILLSALVTTFQAKLEPLILSPPVIAYVLMMKPGSNNSVMDMLVLSLKYLIFEQQRMNELDLEKKFNYEIDKEYVIKDNNYIFFYELKTINVDLTNKIELSNHIEQLASTLASGDTYEVFTYDRPVNLKANIKHKLKVLSENMYTTLQEKMMKAILGDYYEMETERKNSDKRYALKIVLSKDSYEKGYLATAEESFNHLISKKLNKYEVSEMLHTFITKDYVKKEDDFYLENPDFPKDIRFFPNYVKQDDIYIKTFCISKFPNPLKAGLLASLSHFPNSNITIRYKKSDEDIEHMLNNYGTSLTHNASSNRKSDRWKAGNDESKGQGFYEELEDKSRSVIETSVFIQIWADSLNQLNNDEKSLKVKLVTLGLKAGFSKLLQKDLYFNHHPIFMDANKEYTYTLLNSTASGLYPMSYISKNDYKGVHLGKILSGSALHVDFFARNSNQLNGNTIFVGTSGGGKSTEQDNIIAQEISYGRYNYAIDPEGQKDVMFKRLGGLSIDVTLGEYIINPLEIRNTGTGGDDIDENGNIIIDSAPDVIINSAKNLIDNHIAYVTGFLKLVKPKLQDPKNDLLEMYEIYLTKLYEKFGFNCNADVLNAKSTDYPTFLDLYELIETVDSDLFNDAERKRLLINLSALAKGSYATMFNGHTNIKENRNINFNIQSLLMSGDNEKTNGCLYNILSFIFSRSVASKQRSNLFIDELYLLLNQDAKIIAVYLRDLWKRARKYNLNMFGATQNLVDLLQKGIREITMPIFSNSNKKFIFAPGEQEDEAIKDAFMFSELIMEKVRSLTVGQFLFCEHNSKYVVDSYNKLLPSVFRVATNEMYSIERNVAV